MLLENIWPSHIHTVTNIDEQIVQIEYYAMLWLILKGGVAHFWNIGHLFVY